MERLANPIANPDTAFAPINVLYKHFHDAIRAELILLEAALGRLDAGAHTGTLRQDLQKLKDRYAFLQQIYGYHSSVEDEVSRRTPRACQHCTCRKHTHPCAMHREHKSLAQTTARCGRWCTLRWKLR